MKSRYLWGSMVAAVAVSSLVVVSVSSQAESNDGTIDWKPCPKSETVDCATVEVPLDWSKPEGKKIEVGLARQKATDPDARIGSILMDPGGPGGSGVDKVKSGIPVITDELAARFDLIGFDPRGVNTSAPITCDKDLADKADKVATPTNQTEFNEVADLNLRLAEDCQDRSGEIFHHVDTLNVAKDMDAIRNAMGEEKLNYLGFSYGSLMGQQYAELFPGRIRAMALDGNMDHSLDSSWGYLSSVTSAFEQNFVAFADWCDKTTECALNGQDTRRVYGELRDAAKAGKLSDPETGDAVDFYALSDIAFAANNPEFWSKLATRLKALRDKDASPSARDLPAAEPINAPFQPIWCQDWSYPIEDYKEWESLNARLADEYPNVEWSPYNRNLLSCIGYPGKTTNPQKPLDIEGAPRLMMLGNVHDFATVYPWAQTAAEQSGAALVTYEGYGHTVYGFGGVSDCVNAAVDKYFIDLTTPAEETRCPEKNEPDTDTGKNSIVPQPF